MCSLPVSHPVRPHGLRRAASQCLLSLATVVCIFLLATFSVWLKCLPYRSVWRRSTLSHVDDAHCPILQASVSTDSALVFRGTSIIHEQRDLARHWGSLHKYARTSILLEPGLEEVYSSSTCEGRRNR